MAAKTKIMTKKVITFIVCCALCFVLTIGLSVGTGVAYNFATNVDAFLGITQTDFSNATEALQAGDKLCIEIEEDSIVLFKNENKALPLKENETKINVFGYGSTNSGFLMRGIGSGSSTITTQKQIRLMEALEGYVRDYDLEDRLEEFGHYDKDNNYICDDRDGLDDAKAEWGADHLVSFEVNAPSLQTTTTGSGTYGITEQILTDTALEAAKAFSNIALYTISRTGGENVGEIPDNYLELAASEKTLLTSLRANFDKVIVIINTANTMHLGFLDELDIDACIYVGLTGQSGARAIPEILAGYRYEDVETEDSTPENPKTEVVKVEFSPSGRMTDIVTKSNAVVQKFDPTYANRAASGYISYIDDIYYGYKWYETADADGFVKSNGDEFNYNEVVQYPFGYGQSYTTFSQKITSVTYKDGDRDVALNNNASIESLAANTEITVKVEVENTGDYPGKDVVQLYYTPTYYAGGIEKAHVNLLDFGKTTLLPKNGKQTVALTFTPYDMASYDEYDKNKNEFWGYELEHGNYELKLMKNSHELIEKFTVTRSSDLKIDKDPVTGEEVKNRFTGKDTSWSNAYNGTVYAGLGTDGYEAGMKRSVWFTRSNFAGTFPSTKNGEVSGSAVTNANQYMNDAYADLLPKDYSLGNDVGYRLVSVATYDRPIDDIADLDSATPVLSNPTTRQLEGGLDNNQRFVYDWDLIADLAAEYDSDLWDEFLNQMTASEMKDLIELGGFRRVAVESVGKPRQYDYDGPAGFNTNSLSGNWGGDAPDSASWTAYTSEAIMGCCWNKGLMLALGLSMGAEAAVTNVDGWYAPGVNLHRTPYTARNYEYYSEDGVLSGKLAAYLIIGAKINNLNCYIKHFACSEEGPNPGGVHTWITEQNLRENYLRPFEIAVKEGGANSIMTAFNNVGASWAGANYAMNVEVLRNEWGFRGSLITDWSQGGGRGGMYTRQGVRAGNDLWLNPGVNSISNPLNASQDEVFMRNSAHNLLYTTVDTLNTYRLYQTGKAQVEEGSELATLLAKYGRGELGSGAQDQAFSWWKPVLIIIVVLFGLGTIALGVLLALEILQLLGKITLKKKPATVAATAGAGETSVETTEATETADMITCPHCGEQLPAGAKFCGKCGNAIDKE